MSFSKPSEYESIKSSEYNIGEVIIKKKKPFLAFFFLGVFSLLCGAAVVSKNLSKTTVDLHSDVVRQCNFLECEAAQCNHDLDPYICVTGLASMGCSSEISHWDDKELCDDFCCLKNCADEKINEYDFPRKCDFCSKQECDLLNTNYFQSCGSDTPYVCLAGENYLGCSSNKFHWAAMKETACNSCCNKESC
jgi:hypothetical protein